MTRIFVFLFLLSGISPALATSCYLGDSVWGAIAGIVLCPVLLSPRQKQKIEKTRKIRFSFREDDFKSCRQVSVVETNKDVVFWKKFTDRCKPLALELAKQASLHKEANAVFIQLSHPKCKARHTKGIAYFCPENKFSCARDTDCMLVGTHCGDVMAINKFFHNDHEAMIEKTKRVVQCSGIKAGSWPEDAKAVCSVEKCEVVLGKKDN